MAPRVPVAEERSCCLLNLPILVYEDVDNALSLSQLP